MKRFNLSSLSLAGVWFTLTVLYVENQAFHNYVSTLFARFPHFLQEFVIGLVIPLLLVWKPKPEAKP